MALEGGCAPSGSFNPAPDVSSCAKSTADGFEVHFQESQATVLASAIALRSDSKVRLVSFPEQDLLVGSKSSVKYIDRTRLCSPANAAHNYPSGYCVDPMQVAVNWSVTLVYNNQIFTKGSSIYVQVVGQLRGVSEEDIRAAYNTALGAWAYALQGARSSLEPELQKYVDESTARSANFILVTPPQVLRMRCIDNALAVVKWYAERQDVFPLDRSDYVAMAQVEGRTVLLNANDNVFGVVQGNQDLRETEVSLVAVFVHELGHSFGMPDRPHSAEPSVMDPYYVFTHIVKGYLAPTPFDSQVFAGLLKQSIAGAAPGVLNATECAGLRRADTKRQ
jgi:hypothetical protein